MRTENLIIAAFVLIVGTCAATGVEARSITKEARAMNNARNVRLEAQSQRRAIMYGLGVPGRTSSRLPATSSQTLTVPCLINGERYTCIAVKN
jgi:hypothetical protein